MKDLEFWEHVFNKLIEKWKGESWVKAAEIATKCLMERNEVIFELRNDEEE